jgi:hypothetical protein
MTGVLLAHVNYAQESEGSSNATYNFQKGLWAMQFKIQYNFTLSPFQGGTISAKVHTSDKSAIRFGLSMNGGYGNEKEERINRVSEESTTKYHWESLTFDLQYIHYPTADKRAKFFWGLGPMLTGYHKSTLSPSSSRILSLRGGLTVVLGVEYIVSAHIGLTAEYGTSIEYIRTYHRSTSGDHTDKYVEEDIIVNSNAVKFGVSVYM